jgi:hypothetical protein
LEVFVRRPPVRAEPFVSGRHPKTFTKPEMLKPSKSLQCFRKQTFIGGSMSLKLERQDVYLRRRMI